MEVIDTPLHNYSDTVTRPPTGPTIPATGGALSVQQTGMDPTNAIGQRLPEAVNPVVVDSSLGAPGTSNSKESKVVPTPGAG